MPAPPEMGFIRFNPPIEHNSPRYHRAWELIKELDCYREIVFSYKGNMLLCGLGFPTKEIAMMFKLRL